MPEFNVKVNQPGDYDEAGVKKPLVDVDVKASLPEMAMAAHVASNLATEFRQLISRTSLSRFVRFRLRRGDK